MALTIVLLLSLQSARAEPNAPAAGYADLARTAASQEKARNFRAAVETQFKMIRQFHDAEDRRLSAELRKNSVQPAGYSRNFKNTYFNIFNDESQIIQSAGRKSELSATFWQSYEAVRRRVEALEVNPEGVSHRTEEVAAATKKLEMKSYSWKFRVFLDYMSWQTEATLVGPSGEFALLATNQGISPGAGVSYQNGFYSFTSDLNLIYGSAGVSTLQGGPIYRQSDVPAFGGRLSVAGALIVSASKAELGLRVGVWYVNQNLTTPSTPGYSVEQAKKMSETISLYSRWLFSRYFFQTDFGRYLGRPATTWALGFGSFL